MPLREISSHRETTVLYFLGERGYDTVDGRCTFLVVFPGRQLRIHCSGSEWSFSTNWIAVT